MNYFKDVCFTDKTWIKNKQKICKALVMKNKIEMIFIEMIFSFIEIPLFPYFLQYEIFAILKFNFESKTIPQCFYDVAIGT